MAGRGKALDFVRAFSERWATCTGYLYIGGHVRPYPSYGCRKYKLPKTNVQRRRLCMPATTDYWVSVENDANAEPLLFVTAPAASTPDNERLLKMMDEQLLPEIRELAGEERRVTLIFDREAWSPKRFRTWSKAGFDVITYRKGKYRQWQRRCFKKVVVEISGRKVTYLLAHRMVRVLKGLPNRTRTESDGRNRFDGSATRRETRWLRSSSSGSWCTTT